MTVSVSSDGSKPGKLKMEFVNLQDDYEMLSNTPYGLQVLLRKHLTAGHDRVVVDVIGPK